MGVSYLPATCQLPTLCMLALVQEAQHRPARPRLARGVDRGALGREPLPLAASVDGAPICKLEDGPRQQPRRRLRVGGAKANREAEAVLTGFLSTAYDSFRSYPRHLKANA